MNSSRLVWHYTNLEKLALILDKGYLLATEVSFQNDILETSTADAAFENALEELSHDDLYRRFVLHARGALRNVDSPYSTGPAVADQLLANARFILCASEDGDSLYAWRTYGASGISCAIGLDPTVPLGVVGHGSSFFEGFGWTPVVYDEHESRGLVLRKLRELGDEWNKLDGEEVIPHWTVDITIQDVPDARAFIRARAKNPSFTEEKEHRVTIEPRDIHSVITLPSGMGPRPHLRLTPANAWGATVLEGADRELLPIRAVRLGPDAPQSALEGLRWLLLSHHYPVGPQAVVVENDDGTFYQYYEDSIKVSRSSHGFRTT